MAEEQNNTLSLKTALPCRRLYCNVLLVHNVIIPSYNANMQTFSVLYIIQKLTIVLATSILQLANQCDIALNKEMLPLLHKFRALGIMAS